ncbi:hypothetical protein FOG51_03139 [Hanseniaspora uvarum]|nr:hypothetical protein FOG48_01455 [Hanseniaspora uvarum]KAF0271758.1 hypothetical protein FOG51_03139 [Hanseniaspora uvarum]
MSERLFDLDDDEFIVPDETDTTSPATNFIDNHNNTEHTQETDSANKPGNLGTLDEPVSTTILRDLTHIKSRLWLVLYPASLKKMFLPMTMSDINEEDLDHFNETIQEEYMKNDSESVVESPELWAPLIFNLVYSKILSGSHNSFAFFFIMTWLMMTILSYHLKIYQKVSIVGKISIQMYCFFPIVLNCILVKLVLNPLVLNRYFINSDILGMKVLGLTIKSFLAVLTSLWAFYTCMLQLSREFSQSGWDKKISVQNIPVFMVYLFLNWFNVL